MALGGIPYYWSFLKKGQSVAQNFDRMFFQMGGELSQEFDALYASLFKKPRRHIAIITALAKEKSGLLREEVLKTSKLTDNTDFSKALQELVQCGFVRETETEKTVLLTMITSFGLTPGGYSNDIHCQLTMADLFR